eukprot:TRINITY_DN2376_c0_g1_i2.p1 TRINITY_DN2376_c0_g1~~TRINITY_DN2376_c0_g1_i2.p1  ORF type:complete len:163 (+),score=68.34 TRINITY_DN2376_c0_g1_i2:75-563(+)
MMFKKGGVEKRLKKISKHEAASLKLLEKQESELEKAVEENDEQVETILGKESPAEVKIRVEIEKLTRKLQQLDCELGKVHALREKEVRPLRFRGDDLVAKLETVRSQLASSRTIRERSLSTTSLDMRDKSKLDLSLARDVRNSPGSAPVLDKDSPPPYNNSF